MNNIQIIQFGISLEKNFCADQGEKDDTNIQRCLLLANMYADVQILHQIAIACYKMANANPAKKSAEKRESSRDELLNDKLDKLLKRDIEVLSFLMNLPPGSIEVGGQQIHIFAKLYSNPIAYQSLKTYLDVLLKKNSTKLKAYAFSEKGLKGRRTLRTPGSYATLGYNVHSLFVPHDTYIYLYHMNNYKGSKSGPYFGPAMYEVVRSPGIWSSLKVFSTKNRDARKMLRICGEPDLKGECIALRISNTYDLRSLKSVKVYSSAWGSDKYECREENGRSNRCERADLPLIDYWDQTYDQQKDEFYCSINGSRQNWDCFRSNDWTWRVRSMVIPLGYTMKVHQDSSALNKQYLNNMIDWYGPYTGPQVAAELPPFASKLEIKDTDSSKLQIRLCTKPNLKGQCGEVTIDQRKVEEEEGKQTIDVTEGINNIPFHMFKLFEHPWDYLGYEPENTELRSIKIPDGYDIIRYTRKEDKTEVMSDTLSGYVKNIHPIWDSGRKAFKLEVKKKSETRFKAETVKEKEDTIF